MLLCGSKLAPAFCSLEAERRCKIFKTLPPSAWSIFAPRFRNFAPEVLPTKPAIILLDNYSDVRVMMSTIMTTKPNNVLGHFEHLVVTAIASLTSEDSEAFGLAIRDVVEELYGGETEVNLGSIYATLERLEDKGYAKSWESEP